VPRPPLAIVMELSMAHGSDFSDGVDRDRVSRMYSILKLMSDRVPHSVWPSDIAPLMGWPTYETVPWQRVEAHMGWDDVVFDAWALVDRRKSQGEVVNPEVEITICCLPLVRQCGVVEGINNIDSFSVSCIQRAILGSIGHWSKPYLGILLYEYALDLCQSRSRLSMCLDPLLPLVPIEALLCDISTQVGLARLSASIDGGEDVRSLEDLKRFAESRSYFLHQRSPQLHSFMVEAFLQRQAGPTART
jgi:hypothetical protein